MLVLMLFAVNAEAQQLPIFSQYVLNGFILNPAMAGYDGYTSVNTTGRQQWLGMKDAPQTFSASWQTRLLQKSYRIVNHPVRSNNMLIPSTKGRVGLGAYVINDANGNVARTGIQFTYAYHIIMNNHQLSFGLAGKAFQYRIATENLTFGGDNDPLVNGGIKGVGYSPDLDLGIYFTNTYYFLGASVSNVLESTMSIGDATTDFSIERHYWAVGGYRFRLNPDIEIEPNVLLKTTENWIPQGDFGIRTIYMEDFWGGLAYRTDNSIVALFGLKTNGVYVGYAFDFSLTAIQQFNWGTHEMTMSVKFGDNARRYRWLRRY